MMRSFILLLVFICVALSASCGKTGDLYLPGDNESLEKTSGGGPSSKTDSTTGR